MLPIKRENNQALYPSRCFKKLADEDTSCPHDDDNDDFYAEYDTAYENAFKHWNERVNEKKNEGKRGTWLTERQNELTTFYNSFKKRCIPQFAQAACQFHNDNRGGSTNIGDCTTSYTNIINWCINNKTDIQTCNDEIYDTTGKKLNHCISEADSSARYCGKATITGQQFASDLKLDADPIVRAIYKGWKIITDSSSVYVESKDETKRIYVCD